MKDNKLKQEIEDILNNISVQPWLHGKKLGLTTDEGVDKLLSLLSSQKREIREEIEKLQFKGIKPFGGDNFTHWIIKEDVLELLGDQK